MDAITYKSEVADSMRMRFTRLLNMSGKAGRGSGNSLAVMGLFFSSAESAMGSLSDDALPESANSIAAGTCSGAPETSGLSVLLMHATVGVNMVPSGSMGIS